MLAQASVMSARVPVIIFQPKLTLIDLFECEIARGSFSSNYKIMSLVKIYSSLCGSTPTSVSVTVVEYQ